LPYISKKRRHTKRHKTKTRRTKPDTPSAEQLAEIEAVFNALAWGLQAANKRFVEDNDAGRGGVIDALMAVIEFIQKSNVLRALGVAAPLVRLCGDLESLDDGKVSALLTPKKLNVGRSPATRFYNALKGLAIFTARRLQATGMSPIEACAEVARTLNEMGVRPARKGKRSLKSSQDSSGRLTERTVRTWQEQISADVGVHTTAAQTLRESEEEYLIEVLQITGLASLPPGVTADKLLLDRFPAEDIRRAVLDRLAIYVRKSRSAETT
jgi:hypothetical protein